MRGNRVVGIDDKSILGEDLADLFGILNVGDDAFSGTGHGPHTRVVGGKVQGCGDGREVVLQIGFVRSGVPPVSGKVAVERDELGSSVGVVLSGCLGE